MCQSSAPFWKVNGCNSAELFDKLAIASEEGYESNLNKYNVIHLNMIDFLSRTDSINDHRRTGKSHMQEQNATLAR